MTPVGYGRLHTSIHCLAVFHAAIVPLRACRNLGIRPLKMHVFLKEKHSIFMTRKDSDMLEVYLQIRTRIGKVETLVAQWEIRNDVARAELAKKRPVRERWVRNGTTFYPAVLIERHPINDRTAE